MTELYGWRAARLTGFNNRRDFLPIYQFIYREERRNKSNQQIYDEKMEKVGKDTDNSYI
jgi:hypothetical protein